MKVEVYVDGKLVNSEPQPVLPAIDALELSREDLIQLCDLAIVPEQRWLNRDSAIAQTQIGQCRQLLLAGCQYTLLTAEHDRYCQTSEDTIWIEIAYKGFSAFENVSNWDTEEERFSYYDKETFYIPTMKRLMERFGRDWY